MGMILLHLGALIECLCLALVHSYTECYRTSQKKYCKLMLIAMGFRLNLSGVDHLD